MQESAFAIVPARAGSKGLPDKNIRLLNGVPLYERAIRAAKAAKIKRIYITTDISEILHEYALERDGIQALRRPPQLAGDASPMSDVLFHVFEQLRWPKGPAVLLQPTSPLRTPEDIRRCLALYESGRYSTVMTVTEADVSVRKMGGLEGDTFVPFDPVGCFSNRQSLGAVYRPNGAVYVIDPHSFRLGNGFSPSGIGGVIMEESRSVDVDSAEDLVACARLVGGDI